MNLLDTIVEHKRDEVRSRKREVPPSRFSSFEYSQRRPVPFGASLNGGGPIAVIAEIKRISPSAGTLRARVNPAALARSYAEHGARAISVLTDHRFFSGSLDDLLAVRRAVSLPVLRKDFIVDEYQLMEAKAHGADAVLLIASILDDHALEDLLIASEALGLDALVEIHDRGEIDRLDFGMVRIVGINNRDLRTFTVNPERTRELAPFLPADVCRVSESGIKSAADLRMLKAQGIRAALIGEHLMKSRDPGAALETLLRRADEPVG